LSHRADPQVLFTLRMLLQDGVVDLPNGERLSTELYKTDPNSLSAIKPGFRVIGLGLTPPPTKLDDARDRYLSSSLGFSYFELRPATVDDMMNVVCSKYVSTHPTGITSLASKIKEAAAAVVRVNESNNKLLAETVNSLLDAGAEHPELKLSLRHILRLHRLIDNSESELDKYYMKKTLERTLMIPFMPATLSSKFHDSLNIGNKSNDIESVKKSINIDERANTLQIGSVTVPRRQGKNPELVPRPLFHDNSAHLNILEELLFAFQAGERSLLLIGNQGVGKNKLVDRLLEAMNAEREYIQLHRDTTIQSLTILPSLEDGRIKYEDSPMIRAARLGRVLIVDEADKAPLEVVCLLKALAEDGEVILYDGRRLLSRARLEAEGGDVSRPPSDVIVIHPDFALFVLANRPGFPFLGNNFFRECGDAFSVHVVENLDYKSEIELLRAYGPDVHLSILSKLAASFASLRDAHSKGDLTYPFSAREAVAVVKHLQSYPQDGVASAVEDILGFDSLTPVLRSQIATIFQGNGLPVPLYASGTAIKSPPVELSVSKPLPASTVHKLKFTEATNCSVSAARSMRRSDWTSNVTHRSSYTVESSRVLRFSEEIGRITLTKNQEDARHSLWAGRVLGMATDNSDRMNGSLHVLTSDPLTVHSFSNVGSNVDALRGKQIDPQLVPQIIKRELLSEELSYRLGTIQPMIVSLAANNVASSAKCKYTCAVLIPDMSMALAIPTDPEVRIQMLTLPMKSATQQATDKYKEAVMMFSKSNSTGTPSGRNGTPAAVSSIDQPGFVLYYRREGSPHELVVIDFNHEYVTTIDIAGAAESFGAYEDSVISSVTSLGNNSWSIVVSPAADSLSNSAPQTYLLSLDGGDERISSAQLQLFAAQGGSKPVTLSPAVPLDTYRQSQLSNRSSFGSNSGVIVGGNSAALGHQVIMSNGTEAMRAGMDSLKLWPRPSRDGANTNKTSAVVMSSAADDSIANLDIARGTRIFSLYDGYSKLIRAFFLCRREFFIEEVEKYTIFNGSRCDARDSRLEEQYHEAS
jgi:hypothetical protein